MNIEFLKGTAIFGLIGVIVGFWNQVKALLWKIVSIFIQRVEIGTEEAHEAVIAYLVTHFKRVNSYDKNYGATNESMRNGKYGLIAFEKFGSNSMLFWSNKKIFKSCRFLFLFSTRKDQTTAENLNHHGNANGKIYSTITFIRGSLDIDVILENSAGMRNKNSWQLDEKEQNLNRFAIHYFPGRQNDNSMYGRGYAGFAWYNQKQYRLLGYKPEDIGQQYTSNGSALDNLFFPKTIKDLIHNIAFWVKSKDWYKEKNIPWKRGWLLYGPPGTGKTALARAFAEDLNMPIYVFSLSRMSNNDLIDAWKDMQLNIPCIALIEDIDNVFHGRKNISADGSMLSRLLASDNDSSSNNTDQSESKGSSFSPLTFDCLLNCLDGVDKSEGVFTIITTNDIMKIDAAIGHPKEIGNGKSEFVSTRPGRIDKAIELGYMEKENKIEMAHKILGEFPLQLNQVLEYIQQDKDETPAQFQEYCAQIAIKEYWNEKELNKEAESTINLKVLKNVG